MYSPWEVKPLFKRSAIREVPDTLANISEATETLKNRAGKILLIREHTHCLGGWFIPPPTYISLLSHLSLATCAGIPYQDADLWSPPHLSALWLPARIV